VIFHPADRAGEKAGCCGAVEDPMGWTPPRFVSGPFIDGTEAGSRQKGSSRMVNRPALVYPDREGNIRNGGTAR